MCPRRNLVLIHFLAAAIAYDVSTNVAKRHTLFADEGANVTLHCTGREGKGPPVQWTWGPGHNGEDDRGGDRRQRIQPQENGDLVIQALQKDDSRSYTCLDSESNESLHTVLLHVRTVPNSVSNFSVFPNSVFALLTWSYFAPADDPENPVTNFEIGYRRDKSRLSDMETLLKDMSPYEWTTTSKVGANQSSYTLYNLEPNTTYYFRICATNRLGCGEMVNQMATTKPDPNAVNIKSRDETSGSWK
jgi:hypothetical protein